MENNAPVAPFDWGASLSQTYTDLTRQIIEYAPKVLGALALLALGYLVAIALRAAARRFVLGLESLFGKLGRTPSAGQQRIEQSSANLIGNVVFWCVILFFVAASANTLGWSMFTGWLDSLIGYLPNLLTGLGLILVGYVFGNGARSAVLSTAGSAGVDQPELLARTVQIIVLLTMTLIGIEQIGIQVSFLTTTLVVVIGVLLASGGLAFGLGARDLVANIIGAQYARKHCRIGEVMRIGPCNGELLEITQTSLVLDCQDGRAVVPAKLFQQRMSKFGAAIQTEEATGNHDGGRS